MHICRDFNNGQVRAVCIKLCFSSWLNYFFLSVFSFCLLYFVTYYSPSSTPISFILFLFILICLDWIKLFYVLWSHFYYVFFNLKAYYVELFMFCLIQFLWESRGFFFMSYFTSLQLQHVLGSYWSHQCWVLLNTSCLW